MPAVAIIYCVFIGRFQYDRPQFGVVRKIFFPGLYQQGVGGGDFASAALMQIRARANCRAFQYVFWTGEIHDDVPQVGGL